MTASQTLSTVPIARYQPYSFLRQRDDQAQFPFQAPTESFIEAHCDVHKQGQGHNCRYVTNGIS